MVDVHLIFCVLLVVLVAAPDKRRRSLFFSFELEKVERPKSGPQGTPWTRFAQRKPPFPNAHINLVLSGFAHQESDLGLSTFSCMHWSNSGEVAPLVPLQAD